MTPYFTTPDGSITIYHADCREVLPTLRAVDLVLTDPPYGVGKTYASHVDTTESLSALVADVMPRLELLSSKRLITCGVGNIWKYPPADWIICWWKPNAMTRSAVANANVWEPVLVYGCKGFGVDGVTATITPQPFDHPCPKPIRLMRWLIERSTQPGDVVLDPFGGSGTTMRACMDLGRLGVMIELEERYCEIAARRLSQQVLPLEVPA